MGVANIPPSSSPFQDLVLFVNRISELVKNMFQQLSSLYSSEG